MQGGGLCEVTTGELHPIPGVAREANDYSAG